MTVRPPVRSGHNLLPGYHSPQVEVGVRLNTNESPYPPPPRFFERLTTVVAGLEVNRYPDRDATQLREAIARLHGVQPENVFCGNGSNEVIQTLALTYGGPGRVTGLFDPTFDMHAHISRIAGGDVVIGARDSSFAIDPTELAAVALKSDILFLCSPNNPTGVIEPPDHVRIALDACSGVVVVDEAYGQFADWSAQSMQDEETPLLVLCTFSKTWAMAGVRLGYAIGPSWMIENLWKTALPYHLSQLTQAAGLLALEYEAEMNVRVTTLVAERERVLTALGDLAVDTWPSQANFILLRPRVVSSQTLWQNLLERSILVRDCSTWPGLDGCLRVTIGTEEENTLFLDAMKEALA